MRKVTIVSDGIPRDATGIDGVTLQTHCDATISEITDKVQSGEVTLQDFDYVIFHVGTHDVSNKASFEDIISDFGNLIGICRNTKPGIKITISAIVPRLVDDEETEPLLKKINGYLDKTMSKKINFKFIRTYRPFIYCGKIRPEFYAKKKGINLNAEGTRRIRHFFLRVISTM